MIVFEETRTSRRCLIALAGICVGFVIAGLILGGWFYGSLYGMGLVVVAGLVFALHRRHARAHDLDDNLEVVKRLGGAANLWLLGCAVGLIIAMAASLLPTMEARLLIGVPFAALGFLGRVQAGRAWVELVQLANSSGGR